MSTVGIRIRYKSGKFLAVSLLVFALARFSTFAAGPPPIISVQPLDQIVPNGGTATFIVVVVSATAVTYQWYKDDEQLDGENSSILTITDVSGGDEDRYRVKVKNGGGTVYSRWATLTILGNNVPEAEDDSYTTTEDTRLVVSAPGVLDNDDDHGEDIRAFVVGNVTHGTLILTTNGAFVYWPETNYFGTDSFTYRVADGPITGNVATVTINITPANDAPIANNDSYTARENGTLTISAATGVLANDSDVENQPLTAVLVTDVDNGILALNPDGSFTYTPDPGFWGNDSFRYRATDGLGSSSITTVFLRVRDGHTPLVLSEPAKVPGGFQFQVSGPTDSPFVICASTNLFDWTPISTNSAPLGTILFQDLSAGEFPVRFYRAKLQDAEAEVLSGNSGQGNGMTASSSARLRNND